MVKRIPLFLLVCLGLLAAGCGAGGPGGPGPRTWIDAPLDGSAFELGPVIVRSHAASDGGTAQAALLVNGEQVRVDAAADSSSPLVEFAQSWVPEREGEYTLQVISTDHEGNEGRSNTVRIIVGEVPLELTATPTPTGTATPTEATPTATEEGEPIIHFDQNVNCRLGDTTGYEVVTSFSEGEERPIDGRNAATTWFWVLMPQGGHCWVAGSTGTLSGPYESVPIIAPPTLTPEAEEEGEGPNQPPSAPSNLQVVELTCSNQDGYQVQLSWQDNSDNESGFRIYHNGSPVATVGANVEQYVHSVGGDISQQQNYRVEAYNSAGAAQSNTASEDGCLY